MHVMLDIETMGTRPGAIIRSIGAVTFDLGSGLVLDNTFYRNITDESCREAGLAADAATIAWWQKQPQETQDIFNKDPVPLAEALSGFYSWFYEVGGIEVWSQGAAFDTVLVEHAMRAVGIVPPWRFNKVRDTRTVYQLANYDFYAAPREGIAHYALDDCHHQIKCVNAAVKVLGGIPG